jgi:hypothetical protein
LMFIRAGLRWGWREREVTGGMQPLRTKECSGAEVIRAPGLDHLFDAFACDDLFREDFARESGKFGVAGEAERDQLAAGEFGDARFQIVWQELLHAQTLFQPDDPILHFHREGAGEKDSYQQGRGGEHGDAAIEGKSEVDEAVNGPAEVNDQGGGREKMKRGNILRVVRKVLFSHETFPDLKLPVQQDSYQCDEN